jgi:poly-gamma-glutamate synthesis protein (capsule biosynthesis protein)
MPTQPSVQATRPKPQPSKPTVATSAPPKKRSKKGKLKKLVVAAPLVVILVGGAGAFSWYKNHKPKSSQQPQVQSATTQQAPQPSGSIRLFATGDNLAFESINTAAKTATGYDYTPMLSNFKPLFAKADIRLCNETTIGGGESLGVSGYPSFNSSTAWSTGFADTGCNLMNLGSDHTNDKGQAGIDAMVATWSTQPGVLAYAGANRSAEEQAQIRYFTVKQVKFAYLSYTTRTVQTNNTPFGINLYNTETAKQQIEEARKNAKLVLVSITWGNEDQQSISGDQERVAQELADAGADVVFGNGPHVLQAARILDGNEGHQTLVWFSLGNFLNSQLPVNNLIGGMAVIDFDIATGNIRDPKLMPVYMHYEWTAAQKAAGTVNARTNFKLYPLDLAADALAKSQNGTTVEAQMQRVTELMTSAAPIQVIKSTDL